MAVKSALPRWNDAAARAWDRGRRQEASDLVRAALEADPAPPAEAYLQLGAYLFNQQCHGEAVTALRRGTDRHPDDLRLLGGLASALVGGHAYGEALPLLERLVAAGRVDLPILDGLAYCYGATGDVARSRLYGTQSLMKKDKLALRQARPVALDLAVRPDGKRDVIAFTLFGSHPRYLRGALANLLAARDHYPGWTCRFYVDDSVDPTFRAVMADEGAELAFDDRAPDRRWQLVRRFLVSDDPGIGRFLVRDCDSVVSAREAAAVADWVASGQPFHAMRDWYTHTGLMMAGMWGGIAGVFPDMAGRLDNFRRRHADHGTFDQHFLRDEVWPAIRAHCLVHDRCFRLDGSRPFPTPDPPGNTHVGQNEYGADGRGQGRALAAFAERIPALGLKRADLGGLKIPLRRS